MKISRLCLIGTLLMMGVHVAQAQDYPSQPITSISPFPPGGGAETLQRTLSGLMKDYIGQPFVHVNKPGGGTTVAGTAIATAKPDGYTIGGLVSPGAVPEVYGFFTQASYSSKDLKPIIRIASFPYALFVRHDSPWQTLDQFLAAAKEKPKQLAFAHAGRGHAYQLLMVAVARKAGVELNDLPTSGCAPVINAVLGGHVQAGSCGASSIKEHIEAGKIRMLALQHRERLSWAANVPTFAELGYDFGLAPWYLSLFAPAGTSDAVVNKLHDAIKTAMDDKRFIDFLEKAGAERDYADAEGVRRDIEADRRVFGGLLKELGMTK